MTGRDIRHIFLASIIIFLVVLMLVWIKVGWMAHTHFQKAETFHTQKQYSEAIVEYGEVIRNYTPFNQTSIKASEKLWQMGIEGKNEGDIERSVMAFREIRASYYAVKSFYQPGKDWIARSDEKLETLIPLLENPAEHDE